MHEREAECKIAGAHECRLLNDVSVLRTSLSASIFVLPHVARAQALLFKNKEACTFGGIVCFALKMKERADEQSSALTIPSF